MSFLLTAHNMIAQTSASKHKLQRSASIAGITAHSRQECRRSVSMDCHTELTVQGRRHGSMSEQSVRLRKGQTGKPVSKIGVSLRSRCSRRHHPYPGLARQSIHRAKRETDDQTLSVTETEQKNVFRDETKTTVKSLTVSNMASLFQCNLTLNLEFVDTESTQTCFAQSTQSTDETKQVDQEDCNALMEIEKYVQTMHQDETLVTSTPLDLRKKRTEPGIKQISVSGSNSTTSSVPVFSAGAYGQMPATVKNVVKSNVSILPTHLDPIEHSIVTTAHQGDFSNHISTDAIVGKQFTRKMEAPEPSHCNQSSSNPRKLGTEDEGFFADDEGDDLQVWAPNFDDMTNLWSCLYHTKHTKRSSKAKSAKKQNGWDGEQCDIIPKRLRRQNTMILQPDMGQDTETFDLEDREDEDMKVCIPSTFSKHLTTLNTIYGSHFVGVDDEWCEFAGECRDEDHTYDGLENQVSALKENRLPSELLRLSDVVDLKSEDSLMYPLTSQFRNLTPTYTDFCCWVCGGQLERQEVMDIGEMMSSSSAFNGDVELYCPHCDSARWLFNVDNLL